MRPWGNGAVAATANGTIGLWSHAGTAHFAAQCCLRRPAMSDALVPAVAEPPLDRQRLFVPYFVGILIDLVVLNLFAEYSTKVVVANFTTSLLAAIVLQVLLQGTIAVEHKVMHWFTGKTGGAMTFLKYFCAWLVLFG